MIRTYLRELGPALIHGWNRFWFSPQTPETLAIIRIATGCMLFYTHLVWGLDLLGFLGPEGRLPWGYFQVHYGGSPFAWTLFRLVQSPAGMWAVHVVALLSFVALTLGLWTRIVSVLAFVFVVSYAHRAAGAQFGLDQINVLLSTYLMIGRSGDRFSLDRWLADRRGVSLPTAAISTNIALRLIQIHMCVIYFFAGAGKLQGVSWWEGTAIWLAIANYEYQSFDLTFLGGHPWLINFLTHLTVLWELSYCVLVWPRWTRPLVLALAVPLHIGIAGCLGMVTFGLIMLVGNLAFVPAALVRELFRLPEPDLAVD